MSAAEIASLQKPPITRFCSHKCNSRAYKANVRGLKVEISNRETIQHTAKPIEELKAKEFLTVREVARLLSCSVRSAYYYIERGTIKAVNLGQRITRVKRSEIDKLFEQPQPVTSQPEQIQFDIADCYNLAEIQEKYNISEAALYRIIKRNNSKRPAKYR